MIKMVIGLLLWILVRENEFQNQQDMDMDEG